MQMKNSEWFKEESEEKKQLQAMNKHNQRAVVIGYVWKRVK